MQQSRIINRYIQKISLAGANNSVPWRGLAVFYGFVQCNLIQYSGTENTRRLSAFPDAINGVTAPILHPCISHMQSDTVIYYSTFLLFDVNFRHCGVPTKMYSRRNFPICGILKQF